jgi:hypothetical protein
MFQLPNKGPIGAHLSDHGSFGGVVKACYETCEEPVAWATFARSGTDFIIMTYGIHARLTGSQATEAGNAIDLLLAKEAAKLGVTNLFLVHPDETVELVRTYEPCITALTQLPSTTRPTYLN